MVKEATTDAAICPLCQGENHCARAAGEDAGDCWCVGETFPGELLEQLQEQGARWCICPQCLEKHKGVHYAQQ